MDLVNMWLLDFSIRFNIYFIWIIYNLCFLFDFEYFTIILTYILIRLVKLTISSNILNKTRDFMIKTYEFMMKQFPNKDNFSTFDVFNGNQIWWNIWKISKLKRIFELTVPSQRQNKDGFLVLIRIIWRNHFITFNHSKLIISVFSWWVSLQLIEYDFIYK